MSSLKVIKSRIRSVSNTKKNIANNEVSICCKVYSREESTQSNTSAIQVLQCWNLLDCNSKYLQSVGDLCHNIPLTTWQMK